MQVKEVIEVMGDNGKSPYVEWLKQQDKVTRARLALAIVKLVGGNDSGSRALGDGVSEIRLFFGPGYRIYYALEGQTVILLLGAGTKKRQDKDIADAKLLLIRYHEREARQVQHDHD